MLTTDVVYYLGLYTAAGWLFFPFYGGDHHGCGASNTAVYCYRICGAVELTGSALHTIFGVDQFSYLSTLLEHLVRTDYSAHPASTT